MKCIFSKYDKGSDSLLKPDTGAGMATVNALFSNAHYFDSVICQKKLSMPRMT